MIYKKISRGDKAVYLRGKDKYETVKSLNIMNMAILLYFSFMRWYGKYKRYVKYSNGSLIFQIPSMSCMSCVCTRGSWFSHVKTICNLHVFSYSLLYFLFMNWYGKYRRSVKYSNGSLVIQFPSMSCMSCVCTRGS